MPAPFLFFIVRFLRNMVEINKYIDQTILRPDATKNDIYDFIKTVKKHKFYAAVVNPCWVKILRESLPLEIKVCSVIDFPLGSSKTKVKVYTAELLKNDGVDELDVVMNIGRFKSKDYQYVSKEITKIVNAVSGIIIKVIIETGLLTDSEKIIAAQIVRDGGAHFVKTSTGFSRSGASIEDIKLLRKAVGPNFKIKASGGIRTLDTVLEMINAGADRIGTSAGLSIMEQAIKKIEKQ